MKTRKTLYILFIFSEATIFVKCRHTIIGRQTMPTADNIESLYPTASYTNCFASSPMPGA